MDSEKERASRGADQDMISALNRRFAATRGRRWTASDQRGVTLIELMVATMVFSVVSAATMIALGGALNLNRNDRNRSIAANLAASRMDEIRSMEFEDIEVGQVSETQTVDTVPYTVLTDSEWSTVNATTNACDAPAGDGGEPRVLHVTVRVKWTNMSGVAPVTSQTALAPPIGTYDPQAGHVAVKVVDRLGEPAGGHAVTVTKSGYTDTITTTDEGCAFFAQLNPATYSVHLGTAGYVDGQGVASPERQSIGVNSGFTSAVTFLYDRAGSLDLGFAGLDGYTVPTGIDAVVYNTAIEPAGKKKFANSGSSLSITGLFPYPDGYQVWGGSCGDADPAGMDPAAGRYYPAAEREPAVVVDPGTTASGTIVLKSVDLLVTDSAGAPVPGAVVSAVHTPVSGTDLDCPSGETVALGSTDALGQLKVAMPYGRWTFNVSGRSPVGAWPVGVLDPSAASPATVSVVTQ